MRCGIKKNTLYNNDGDSNTLSVGNGEANITCGTGQ